MDEKVHVVMAADAAYWKGLEVAKGTMVASCSDPGRLEFHVFGEDKALSDRILREFGTYKGSPMAFLRLYLVDLLPDVDWVVYSDVDTLWQRDVLELAGLFDETKSIQWVRDLDSTVWQFSKWCRQKGVPLDDFDPRGYACSGICMINLKRWREKGVLEQCREFAARYGFPTFADQDILNFVLRHDAGLLPGCWDVLLPTPENTPDCVLHLTGVGRCFARPNAGRIAQFQYWEKVARGTDYERPWALPVYLRKWMFMLVMPFASSMFRDRVLRHFAWRWYVKKHWR